MHYKDKVFIFDRKCIDIDLEDEKITDIDLEGAFAFVEIFEKGEGEEGRQEEERTCPRTKTVCEFQLDCQTGVEDDLLP